MTTVVWESHCRTHSCRICGTVYSNLILKCIVSLAKVHFLNVTSSFSFFISRHKKFHRILFRFFIIKKHVHLFSWLPFLVTSVQTLLKEAALSAFVYVFNSFLGPALFMMKTVRFTFFTSKYIERVGSEHLLPTIQKPRKIINFSANREKPFLRHSKRNSLRASESTLLSFKNLDGFSA